MLLWLRAAFCCYCPAPFCRPRGAPTAAAATSVLEGFLIDQAISILAQAKPRSLAKLCALEICDNKKKTTKTQRQGLNTRTEYFLLPGSEQLFGGHYTGGRKLRSNPQSVPESLDSILRQVQSGLGNLDFAP